MKILDRLPLLFLVTVPLFGAGAFFVALTPYLDAMRIAGYLMFALSADLLAYRHFSLIQRTRDGLASVWLVIFAYYKVFFGIAITGIFVLITTRIIEPDFSWIEPVLYALLMSSAAGSTFAAVVFEVCYRRGLLDHRIDPRPRLRAKKRRVR